MKTDSLPQEITTNVNVKVGQPYGNSRSSYGAPFVLKLVVSEGSSIFREKIKRKMVTMSEVIWDCEGPILVRPSANAPQSRYEAFAEQDEEFQRQLTRLWRHAGRRKHGYGHIFFCAV